MSTNSLAGNLQAGAQGGESDTDHLGSDAAASDLDGVGADSVSAYACEYVAQRDAQVRLPFFGDNLGYLR